MGSHSYLRLKEPRPRFLFVDGDSLIPRSLRRVLETGEFLDRKYPAYEGTVAIGQDIHYALNRLRDEVFDSEVRAWEIKKEEGV